MSFLWDYFGYAPTAVTDGQEYRSVKKVEHRMGSVGKVDKFYRVFSAPGVAHCFGRTGAVSTDPVAALVDWVEKGKAPGSIDGATRDEAGDKIARKLRK